MLFGFEQDKEIIPQVYNFLDKQELIMTFLIQYNSCVEDEMKIPLIYGKNAKNIQDAFKNFIEDISNVNFGKIKIVFKCHLSKTRKGLIFKTKKLENYNLKQILKNYTYGLCFNAQKLFNDYVYDKISKQNPNKTVNQKDDLIIVDKKYAILTLCKKINKHNLEIENEIHRSLTLIRENNFSKFYIVCPRNENFTRFIEIKHFLYDLNKTMLKLVPYKISNQLIRRNKCQ
ncbi:hypothetical protein [Campylobacter estrildidarum]|uniref:Uncharacterized protein n=1 Tax=Campylobacter estrildidarum TaxID=2510189 RepID=A0A4U7BK46_9BACT|nr:hypothetical protein [Campylobacter estrildidarum]TKX30575.1 hypothetical protein CQA69_05825 [Campylobacter estrildidarum]